MIKPERISFWQSLWGDVGYYERHAINRAADSIDALDHTNQFQNEQLARLFALDKAQSAEIERLRLTVKVLTEVLVDTGIIDERLLHYRIEAALEEDALARREAEQARNRQRSGPDSLAQALAAPASEAVEEPRVRCMTCSESVLMSRSQIIEVGVVCDSCFAHVRPG